MNVTASFQHYIPYDGDFRVRAGRWRRALKRAKLHPQWRRSKYPWNTMAHRLRWTWAPEAVERWTAARLQVKPYFWLFIAGCNNSGTTLLHRLLGTHPLVRPLPREGQLLTSALPKPTRLGFPRLFSKRLDLFRWTEESDPAPARRVKYDWARHFEPGRGILLAKSPEDALRTRWLQQNFPPVRFVAIVRSPYAVCEGTRRRSGHSIEDSARHWLVTNEILLSDIPHLDRCLLIRYEDFCASPANQLERIRGFLDLESPFDAGAAQSCEVHNIDDKASAVKDFNAKSIARLSPDGIATVGRIARPLMEQLGYEVL